MRLDDNETRISGAPRADVTGVGALEPPCRGFGIAKILKKRQLRTQVDVGLDNSGKNVARCRRRPRPGALSAHRLGDARRFC